MLHLTSAFLTMKYDRTEFVAPNMTSIVHIENFQAYGAIKNTYAIHVQQSHSICDIIVKLLHVTFTNKLALCLVHLDSLGTTAVTVANCSFLGRETKPAYASGGYYQDYYDDDDDDGSGLLYDNSMYDCNAIIHEVFIVFDSMIYSHHGNYNRHIKSNKLRFIGCCFMNNSEPNKLLDLSQTFKTDVEYLQIFIVDCVFYNNHYVQVVSVESYTQAPENYFVSVIMKNVTVSLTTHDYDETISLFRVQVHMTNVILKSNNLYRYDSPTGIISATMCYLAFSGYNEFSNNTAFSVISSTRLYITENTILNFTLNIVNSIFTSNEINSYDHIKPCVIQYTSERGNLDDEFQMGTKLNYFVIFINNRITNVNLLSTGFMHCAWDLTPSAAFTSSIPLHVNKKFINSDNNMLKNRNKVLCLCAKNITYCSNEEIGPFYPGQTVKISITINNVLTNNSVLMETIIKSNSDLACTNDQQSIFHLQSNECKSFEYAVEHSRKWCILGISVSSMNILVHDLLDYDIKNEMFTISLQPCPKGYSLHPQGYCHCDPILSSHIPTVVA